MNDLAELAALRAEVTGRRPEDLEGPWGRLLVEMRTETRTETRTEMRPAAGPRPARRRLWLAGAAAAASAAVAAGLLAWPANHPVNHAANHSANHPAPRTTSPSASVLTVAYVLDHAARAAASSRQPVPRPGQFIYVSSVTTYLSQTMENGGATKSWLYSTDRRIWLSVSGRKAGVLWERELPNKKLPWGPTPPPVTAGRTSWTPLQAPAVCPRSGPPGCLPTLRGTSEFLTTLPTDPAQLRSWIYQHPDGGQPVNDQAWTDIGDMLREMLVPPKLAAALFRVAATIPGARVIPHVTNVLGRPGIAVARFDSGSQANAALIFDPHTYQLLGEGQVLAAPVRGEGPAGTVIAATAQLSVTVVDHLPRYRRAGHPFG